MSRRVHESAGRQEWLNDGKKYYNGVWRRPVAHLLCGAGRCGTYKADLIKRTHAARGLREQAIAVEA